MTRLLFVILILSLFGCKDTPQDGYHIQADKNDTASVEDVIYQLRQETLLYLDTTLENDNKQLIRFHSQLDSSTYQTLQNWIFHNESKN